MACRIRSPNSADGTLERLRQRCCGASPTSPNVPPHPANHEEFAALVLQGFSGKLVSPREAAALLGVNRETLYRLCARGELPYMRVGSVLRIDLAAYVAQFGR
jgi:excisionase family DNA binding protein